MRKLGWALAFHRDEDEMESLRNPAAPQSIGMAARPRGWLGTWEPGNLLYCVVLLLPRRCT